jgi:hypothetical protein
MTEKISEKDLNTILNVIESVFIENGYRLEKNWRKKVLKSNKDKITQ